jgi:hypothetical protein
MKKNILALLVGIIVSCSSISADAKSLTGAFYQLNHELKQIDSNHAEIQFEFINTESNPIHNVILDFSLKDAKNNFPKTGFVFVGKVEPNIPVKGSITLEVPFRIANYYLSTHVLQNTDFHLQKDTVYTQNHFNNLVEIVDEPLIIRSGVAVWSGKITNKSEIPLTLVCFYVDYADLDGNVFKTLLQKWGSLNAGETKPYSFSNLIPKEFKRSEIAIMPIDPRYENAK